MFTISGLRRKCPGEKEYASDINREKFTEILPLPQGVRRRTKSTTVDLYEVFCGVLYVLRSGCQWRMLPESFPKWVTGHAYIAKRSKPDEHGTSVRERSLKNQIGPDSQEVCMSFSSSTTFR